MGRKRLCVKLVFYNERRGGKESNSKEDRAMYVTLVIITKQADIKEVQSLQSISDYYSMFQNIL